MICFGEAPSRLGGLRTYHAATLLHFEWASFAEESGPAAPHESQLNPTFAIRIPLAQSSCHARPSCFVHRAARLHGNRKRSEHGWAHRRALDAQRTTEHYEGRGSVVRPQYTLGTVDEKELQILWPSAIPPRRESTQEQHTPKIGWKLHKYGLKHALHTLDDHFR